MICLLAARGSSCGRILVSAVGLSLQCFDCLKPTARIYPEAPTLSRLSRTPAKNDASRFWRIAWPK